MDVGCKLDIGYRLYKQGVIFQKQLKTEVKLLLSANIMRRR